MKRGIDLRLVRWYRRLLAAYPPCFHLAFGESMTLDFSDALVDAREDGRTRTVVHLLINVTLDLAWSITWQWVRTPVPWLTLAYATAIASVCEGLASAMLGNHFDLSVVAAMLPLVSLTTYTCWFLVPEVRRRRDRPSCLTSAA